VGRRDRTRLHRLRDAVRGPPSGRTIARWAAQIVAWHRSHVTNGPTEAVKNLAKRIKRVAFGLVNFRHHRVRCLLYAGKPDWTLLPTIQP
jgi:transposase